MPKKKDQEKVEAEAPAAPRAVRSEREALELYRELLGRLLRLYEMWGNDLQKEIAWLEQELSVAEG